MKRLLWTGAVLAVLGLASAQDVRSLGMGGLTLPGPAAADLNPAYAAYPGDRFGAGGGFTLPLGLVNLALRPSVSPVYYFTDRAVFKDHFDLLAFYDQATHLGEFVLNPPASPDEIVFHISADGVQITDGAGNPFDLERYAASSGTSTAALPTPLFQFNVPSGVPGLRLAAGAFLDAGGFGLKPDDQLLADLAAGALQPSTTYRLSARGRVKGGVTTTVGYATALPQIPGFEGHLYLGTQVQGFYGLLYADAAVTAETTTDASGAPGPVGYATNTFYLYPGSGQGFGVQLDLGVALDYAEGSYGLGVRNLVGYQRWNGHRRITDTAGNVTSDAPETLTVSGFQPDVYANAAYLQPLEGAGEVLLGADLGYAGGRVRGHLGAEYRVGIVRLRGGLGYEDGLKLGLGAGFAFGPVRTDLALTRHAAPFTGQTVFGLAASLGLSF
ncbi:hypothetical protein [Oceanithermus sp.]|uniref:hypothetical protein n=1 Tax=Oceanithermus sp. TaxID=2268145 RepID=UPI00257FB41A|nr:hypothetical protein [Oceanithermus sp.]